MNRRAPGPTHLPHCSRGPTPARSHSAPSRLVRAAGGTYLTLSVALLSAAGSAQKPAAAPAVPAATVRLAILAAEDRRATKPGDLSTIQAGLRSRDPQTVRIAVRALGRLERPDLIVHILPLLDHPLPELRAEAANAVGQAAQGWVHEPKSGKVARASLDAASAALIMGLGMEPDPSVRAVFAETLGRLPYSAPDQVDRARAALLDLMQRSQSAEDRLGVARGFDLIVRLHGKLSPPTGDVLNSLRTLTIGSIGQSWNGREGAGATDRARDARVRRVAMEALIAAEATDDSLVRRTAADPDGQVRRLTMRALSNPHLGSPDVADDVLTAGLADQSPIVRIEALRAWRLRAHAVGSDAERIGSQERERACREAVHAARDPEPHVALAGLDTLADCSELADAVTLLESVAGNVAQAALPRGWHRAAHAMIALASAAPEKAADHLAQVAGSRVWQLRMYAARAAAILKDRAALETLARDDEDNVREAAIQGLQTVAGHDADAVYVSALERQGYQVLRAAAAALAGTGMPEAAAALKAARRRLIVEGRENSHDARTAIADTLRGFGIGADTALAAGTATAMPQPDAADLRRLTSARTRVVVRGVGGFEMALIAAEAPLSAFRFARLVETGYYNGLTFHRVVPNFVIQGGSPGANEYIGDAAFLRDEVGLWPHVRGAVGISTRGRDTGDAQIFIDLVDNPRLDHEYTVFAHVLSGLNVVDAILEGDVIDRIELVVSR